MKIHACWLDKECRSIGVPAFTYFHFKWGCVRLIPVYMPDLKKFGLSPWNLSLFDIYRK